MEKKVKTIAVITWISMFLILALLAFVIMQYFEQRKFRKEFQAALTITE